MNVEEIVMHIVDQVEGGVCKDIMEMIDVAIDEGVFSKQDFQSNEMSILSAIDDRIFTCASCGWTQPVEQMGEDIDGDFRCQDCEGE